jgi:hypothetical protein
MKYKFLQIHINTEFGVLLDVSPSKKIVLIFFFVCFTSIRFSFSSWVDIRRSYNLVTNVIQVTVAQGYGWKGTFWGDLYFFC